MSLDRETHLASLDAAVQAHLAEDRLEDALLVLGPAAGGPMALSGTVAVGTRLLRAGELQKALSFFDNVITNNNDYDWAFYGRALAYQLLGDEARAQADLEQAIAIAQERRRRVRVGPDGPIERLYSKYRREIQWAHVVSLPLYYLALDQVSEAEALYREALGQAPGRLLRLAMQRLQDLLDLFPDRAPARTLHETLAGLFEVEEV